MVDEPPLSAGPVPGLDAAFGKAKGMVFPRVVLVGHGVLADLASTCRDFDFPRQGAVITGPKTGELAGHRATQILNDGGFDTTTVIAREATEAEVARVEAAVRESGARFLVGVGGGSKIDITKVVAARRRIPFVSLPTSAAHDGISSPRASLHGVDTITSTEAAVPIGVIADTELIVQAPFRLLASGCADVISNTTAVLDWRLALATLSILPLMALATMWFRIRSNRAYRRVRERIGLFEVMRGEQHCLARRRERAHFRLVEVPDR